MYIHLSQVESGLESGDLSARHKLRLEFRYRFFSGKSYEAAVKPAKKKPAVKAK